MADREKRKLAAVIFTDIAGYTAMVQSDEQKALKLVDKHRSVLHAATQEFHGHVVQFWGDGSLSYHESAIEAVRCAIAIQKIYLEEPKVPVRIGIHLGDVVFREDTVFGDGVNVASRIQDLGKPGSILASEKVIKELSNQPEITSKFISKEYLKNVTDPVGIYAFTLPFLEVPTKKQLQRKVTARRKRAQKRKNLTIGLGALALLAAVFQVFVFNPGSFQKVRNLISGEETSAGGFTQEKIAVLPFENMTSDSALAIIGKMTSHWITKGLQETSDAQVVSFQSVNQYAPAALASSGNLSLFSQKTGAVNVVKGQYVLDGDELIFQSWIENLSSGVYIETFPDLKTSKDAPLDAIRSLESTIKGYWASREDNTMTIPNYEAYEYYLKARDVWQKSGGGALSFLKKAIEEDSSFIEPYFLIAENYYNYAQYSTYDSMITSIVERFPNLTERQANNLKFYQEDLRGDNLSAYTTYISEYEYDKLDPFNNTQIAVLALEYVNDPEVTLKYLNDIPYDQLDFDGCGYCRDRLEIGIRANLQIGRVKAANKIAKYIPENHNSQTLFILHNRLLATQNDTVGINRNLKKVESNLNAIQSLYILLMVSRDFKTLDMKDLAFNYTQKVIDQVQDTVVHLARAHYLKGEYEIALQIFNTLQQKNASNYLLIKIGSVKAQQGQREEALKVVQDLEQTKGKYDYGYISYYQGVIYNILGETDLALGKLKQSVAEGRRFYFDRFDHEPDLITLFDHPEYQKIIHPNN